jgi:DNA-binding transcriptional regulator YhcF (GntR family)
MQNTRKSFPEAVIKVLEVLKKEGSLSVNALSKEAKVNRRTVEKTLKLLMEIQPYFQEIKVGSVESNWRKLVEVKERTGLLGLPENVQNLIIRTMHYPTPSEQEIILIHLLLSNAFTSEKALHLNRNQTVQQLVKQGQILETDGKLFLSDEGKIVAEGALQVFPELSEMNRHASICSE